MNFEQFKIEAIEYWNNKEAYLIRIFLAIMNWGIPFAITIWITWFGIKIINGVFK